MDTAVLVGLVMAIVQVIKKWPVAEKIHPYILVGIVSLLVVGYKALETGGTGAFTFELLVKWITVVISAAGAYKLIKVAATPA